MGYLARFALDIANSTNKRHVDFWGIQAFGFSIRPRFSGEGCVGGRLGQALKTGSRLDIRNYAWLIRPRPGAAGLDKRIYWIS